MTKLLDTICLSAIFVVILSGVSAKPQQPSLKIINGTAAEEGEFPYIVQILHEYDYFFCAGSIISDIYILTSAECVQEAVPGAKVVYGTNDLAQLKDVPTAIQVKSTYLHPQFAYMDTPLGAVPIFDIGVLELEHAIPLDAKAQPVKLADAGAQVPIHKNGTLAGWGVNETFAGAMESYLKKNTLQLLNDAQCDKKYSDYTGKSFFNSTHNVCDNNYWMGQCFGDNGDPFVVDGVQYGLASWNFQPCGASPGAYARLTNPTYRDFIKDVTGI